MPIQYVVGDVTEPTGPGPKVVVHCCNDAGRFGAGVSGAIGRRFPEVERAYRSLSYDSGLTLGQVQYVLVEPELWVANLIGQHGIRWTHDLPPIRYWAITAGLIDIAGFCRDHHTSVHMPRMGAGLAGGDWSIIEKKIIRHLVDKGISVTVYDLE
jgi:O-acetyl-ADP-ribose deacetylase (regulator of RNase III)